MVPGTSAPGRPAPRAQLLRVGAVPALLAVLREDARAPDAAVAAAAEALECLVADPEGVQAVRGAGGVEVLRGVVARGKRRAAPQRAAAAASAALVRC
jgi:hypothetical protein